MDPEPQTSGLEPQTLNKAFGVCSLGREALAKLCTAVSILQQRVVRERTPVPSCPRTTAGGLVLVPGHAGHVINKLLRAISRSWRVNLGKL